VVDRIIEHRFAGVTPNHRGFPKALACCAWDVETAKGRPYAWGFGPDRGDVEVRGCTDKTLLPQFVRRVGLEITRHEKPLVVVWAHVLRYDLGVALYPHLTHWNPQAARHGMLDCGGASLEYFFGKLTFAKIRWRRGLALVLDSYRFFSMSLDAAAAYLGLVIGKLEHPDGFGVRRISLEEIRAYLVRDVEITRTLGQRILSWHKEHDLYPSLSVAQLSMRTFRRHYVKARWQRIPKGPWRASLLAYHAGRNGLYVAPGWHRVTLLDMNSAFPAAMRRLPSFVVGGRWEPVTRYAGVWGFYRLYAGTVQQGTYPILFDHSFRPLSDGPLAGAVWVTGHELRAALRAGMLRDARCVGYVWRPLPGGDRPQARFVRDYFRNRQTASSAEHRAFFKLVLNSLYGKFVARTELLPGEAAEELGDPERAAGPRVFLAGGQFYPVASAWITAQVRVWLWQMERRVSAYHSATDGVMCAPESAAGVPTSKRLGGWKVEGQGWALILRNKLYLVWDEEGRLIKCARHGFDGSLAQLWELVRTGQQAYHVDRLPEWLASAEAGRRPFVPTRQRFELWCSTAGFWPPPRPVEMPSGDGWTRLYGDFDALS
jgi:hypothetical protein